MKLNTKYHGEIEYSEDNIITFTEGMCGFEKLRKYILVPIENNDMFSVLHSVEDLEVGFIVMSPFDIEKNYSVKLEQELTKKLKIKDSSDVIILNTVTLKKDVKDITTNLLAPIIINIKERLGKQIILDNSEYSIKHLLFKE